MFGGLAKIGGNGFTVILPPKVSEDQKRSSRNEELILPKKKEKQVFADLKHGFTRTWLS